ncbi:MULTISPECIES: FxsA family protein [Methylotenera]|uniref:FxsA family protein n=1 Tax=Methylotenera TaxID=359407 RepID=UPI00036357FD|nr:MULTISPECIES: FxsA family protein [Methylotenera]
MRYLIGLILLAFPFAELFLLISLADAYGWWLLFYLVVVGFLGLQLIRGEKLLMTAKMMQSLTAGGNPVKTMIGSARNMVAGVLLIIPGVITDIIAVVLLLIPISKQLNKQGADATNQYQQPFQQPQYQQTPNVGAANEDVIEGEYKHVPDDNEKS